MEEYKSENNLSSVKRRAIDAVTNVLQKLKSKPNPTISLLHSCKKVKYAQQQRRESYIFGCKLF